MSELGNEIKKARVTFVFRGYGDLTLTDQMLYWNKSASSFLTFGILNTLTDDHCSIHFSKISQVSTYRYVNGGLLIRTNEGKEYKFGFKHKKDFDFFYNYLINKIK